MPELTTLECDVLVVGAGAAGLCTAVCAASLGLKVIVVEKQAQVGGTSAWSGGWMWIPRNHLAQAAGIDEPVTQPMAYLREELGEQFDETLLSHYLEHAPRMLGFMEANSQLRFIDGNRMPDFHGRNSAAALGGRSVCAAPFDGRRLGVNLPLLKPALKETTLWGMGIASGADLRHFMQAMQSWRSLFYVGKRLLAFAWEKLRFGRSMQLVNGNALVAALLSSALEKKVSILCETVLRHLTLSGDRVSGAQIEHGDTRTSIRARRAVVLACGGFPHDLERLKEMVPHASTGSEHRSAAPSSNTGDGLRLAESVGAKVVTTQRESLALAPVSIVPRVDGTTANFAHLLERGKPGLVAVNVNANRFVNEADSYFDFMTALLADAQSAKTPYAWLICDHRFIRRYGLGAAKPAPMPLEQWIRNNYILRAESWNSLAQLCALDPVQLSATVERYNALARDGKDLDFGKGDTAYNRAQGDSGRQLANPCMDELLQAPFYALKVVPGSLGSFAGVPCTANAQVKAANGTVIEGLYACGNDMNSIMGGHYPSGGITLGPAMTFAYLAAHHIAQKDLHD